MVDVSVVIVTYNSEWQNIRKTLLSALKQKKVSIQIVIADDGSKKTYKEEIKSIMKYHNFNEYVLINSEINRGTVLNIANAMEFVSGKFTKTIAPGDYFFDEYVLYNWVNYMLANESVVSFGDAVYYSYNGKLNLYETKESPVNRSLYKTGKYSAQQFVDYVIANDTILGAAQMMKTDVLNQYLQIIKNRIIYAEDYMIRIMMYDGIRAIYYPGLVIWYEYGTGISTSKNSKWEKLLHNDFEESNNLISKKVSTNYLQKKFKLYLKLIRIKPLKKVSKVLLFPSVIIYRFKFKTAKSFIHLKESNSNEIEKMFNWINE